MTSAEIARLINESLVVELMEVFLVDEPLMSVVPNITTSASGTFTTSSNTPASSSSSSTTINYDNLWHIVSLLTLSPVQLLTDRETLLRVRSKACDLIIKFFFAQQNPNVMRALTRSPAWQDIVCQLFCVERMPSTNPVPPIVVDATGASGQKNLTSTNDEDDDDVWENIDYNGKFL